MKVRLRVEPTEGEAFEVKTRLVFPQLGIPRRGGTIAVLYDPDDHDELILDGTLSGGLALAADQIRDRAASDERPELGSIADLVEGAAGGGTLDIEALQRQIRKQFAPGTAPFAASSPPEDPVDKLAKLADLKDRGLLTDAEFDAQKARILGES
ncbi:MAG: SHOCT domain-containing protein [Actinobacteria bacterium]|nr:SHOCT domain-containing protein [Actinomycetota bacterium]